MYTNTWMTEEEAKTFGVSEEERRFLFRLDQGQTPTAIAACGDKGAPARRAATSGEFIGLRGGMRVGRPLSRCLTLETPP